VALIECALPEAQNWQHVTIPPGPGYKLAGGQDVSLITVEVLNKETGKIGTMPVAVNPVFLRGDNSPVMLDYLQRIIDPRQRPVLKPISISPR
jgi:hypothetical protein